MMRNKIPTIYVAIDTGNIDHALSLSHAINQVNQSIYHDSHPKCQFGIKLGLEFFNHHGTHGVTKIKTSVADIPLFLDLKYHDIPNTVAGALRGALQLHPDFVNVHALGGAEMMRRARDIVDDNAASSSHTISTKILAVTILTSTNQSDLQRIGMETPLTDQVRRLAQLSAESGMDGVVCSAHEIEDLRRDLGNDFILMVPGIRPNNSAHDDQKRIMAPNQAFHIGATHLVIGRPITQADNPVEAALAIYHNL
jgi:orotidine-5'-phosphate decarboxylase